MLRFRVSYELTGGCYSAAVEGDRDYFEILVLQFVAESLPSRQVKAASSPRGPRDEKDFLAQMVGERMHAPIDIGQGEVRRL